jgi:hypothetical protein
MSILNKEILKDVDLYNMRWESQSFQEIIIDKKNQAEEQILENNTKELIEAVKEGNLSEREIKNFLKYFMDEIRQIERMV